MGITLVPMWQTPPTGALPDPMAPGSLGAGLGAPLPAAAPGSSVANWDDAMRLAVGGGDARVVPVQFVPETTPAAPTAPIGIQDSQPVPGSSPVAVAAPADDGARGRALAGLSLEAPPPAAGPVAEAPAAGASDMTAGQSILEGLSRLRGTLDGQLTSINDRIMSTRMDARDMMALQAEVMSYTLMVDVSSKLAGKSTQALDTLMKGQ